LHGVVENASAVERTVLKSKIHRAVVTEANVSYEGSIEIDEELMELADLWEGERVLVASISSGSRLETYVQRGERGSGTILINGGAAHRIGRGELVTIMAWARSEVPVVPRRILCGEGNRVKEVTDGVRSI
jgi:aspartate 1-decarboxylase